MMHDFLIEFAGFTVVFTVGFWFGWRIHRKGIEHQIRSISIVPSHGRVFVKGVEVKLYDQDEER